MVETVINNQKAVYKNGEWFCDDLQTLELIRAQSALFDFQPTEYYPNAELARAEYVAKELNGLIIKSDYQEFEEKVLGKLVY